jgi:glutamate-5-semialdehyde dehydrogenase
VRVIQCALAASGLPRDAVQYIDNPDRALVGELLRLDRYVDMIIPRGGAGLHKMCKENSSIPVIIGGFGISHVFVDESADLARSLAIIDNAKVQRPSACNALDTLLVHERVAAALLPQLVSLMNERKVALVAAPNAMTLLAGADTLREAGPEDFDTEWLGLTLGVRLVADVNEALAHMREHNAGHSDAILTNDLSNAERFINGAGSAAVYVNASTRFTDGYEFGFGAEIGISNQKLHARGPMGLEELTTYKYVVRGDGQVRG